MQNYKINSQKNTWIAVGVMSGTSVDGLDIAAVQFHNEKQQWKFKLIKAVSVNYNSALRDRLINCIHASGEGLASLDIELGMYIGTCVSDFLNEHKIKPDLIASHGHTVYHQPEKGLTKQIGDGQAILYSTGIITVNDFRTMDVIKGGQGAPLVPVGDQHLFPGYDVCLNIGGFANISFSDRKGNRMAFDTGPANLLLNHLARKLGYPYDSNGNIARKGKLIPQLLYELNTLSYYELPPPKSLGLEWINENILAKIDNEEHEVKDVLHTCIKHIVFHINHAITSVVIRNLKKRNYINILTTGGGSHNQFLIKCLQNDRNELQYILPTKEIIDYKEAIIFAFLGILRLQRKINVLLSVTGSRFDSIGGTIHDNI
jgi:anhydro-N-acetylmuramic acid kinase